MTDSSREQISQFLSEARKRGCLPVRVRIVPIHFAYQSECGDQRAHDENWVEVHRWRQAGHTPPVSNVFHSLPHVRNHFSCLRGDRPQNGQRMLGPDESRLFSSSSVRPKPPTIWHVVHESPTAQMEIMADQVDTHSEKKGAKKSAPDSVLES